MHTLRRYRLLLIVCGLATVLAIREALTISPPERIPIESLSLPPSAELLGTLLPNDPESLYHASQEALFLRFDQQQAREHLEAALATGITADEPIVREYASLLVQMGADPQETEAAVKTWQRHFPHSTAEDPRETSTSFPEWMQAGSLRPLALARGHPLFAEVIADQTIIEITDLVSRNVDQMPLGDHDSVRFLFEFSKAGTRLAGAPEGGEVVLLGLEALGSAVVLQGHQDQVECATFSSDDTRVATGSRDRTIKLWDANSGELLGTLPGHERPVSALAFSHDGRWLASGSWSGELRIWDIEHLTPARQIRAHNAVVSSLAFAPNGETLATGARDNLVKLWKVETGELSKTLEGHEAPIYCVTYSRSGRTLASSSGDWTVRLWTVESGELLTTIDDFSDSVFAVDFAAGRTIVSAGLDNSIRIWQEESD